MRSEIEARIHTVGGGGNITQHRPRKDMVRIVLFTSVVNSITLSKGRRPALLFLSRISARAMMGRNDLQPLKAISESTKLLQSVFFGK